MTNYDVIKHVDSYDDEGNLISYYHVPKVGIEIHVNRRHLMTIDRDIVREIAKII